MAKTEYMMTFLLFKVLSKRGVNLECSYQHCTDKEIRLGQIVMSVLNGERHNSKRSSKLYHKTCYNKMYVA